MVNVIADITSEDVELDVLKKNEGYKYLNSEYSNLFHKLEDVIPKEYQDLLFQIDNVVNRKENMAIELAINYISVTKK